MRRDLTHNIPVFKNPIAGKAYIDMRLTRTLSCRIPLFVLFCCISAAGPIMSSAYSAEAPGVPPLTGIVSEVMTAYGGEKALANIKSVYSKGSIQTFMRDEKGISTRYFKRPRKLRAELFYPHASELRIINGFHGWRGSDKTPLREVHGPPYLAMIYQFKYLDLPFGFLDKEYRITPLGHEMLHGVPVQVLMVVDDEGPMMRVYIDRATHLIIRVAGAFGLGKGATELSAEFSDFRDVGGIKFPFRIVNFSGDNRIAETLFSEIQLNREMPDSLFQP